MKALMVSVYTDGGCDCTNGGPSSRHRDMFVLCDKGPFDIAEDDERLLYVQYRRLFGQVYAELVPYSMRDEWTMFGGNFGYDCDSRFSEMVEAETGYPCRGVLPIHDRVETREEQRMYSE